MFSFNKTPFDVTLSVSKDGKVNARVSHFVDNVSTQDVPTAMDQCYQELKTTVEKAMANENKTWRQTHVFMAVDFRPH